jgi:hypothetical protein
MVAPALKIMFGDVYREQSEKMFGKDYIKEVDFGHNKSERTRRTTQTVHSTPSGSNGSD